MKLRLHRRAVDEIDHEVDYYESRQPGLGAELENDDDEIIVLALAHMSRRPGYWRARR